MGTNCNGKVNNESIFDGQITIPMCEGHFNQHNAIIDAHSAGVSIGEILTNNAPYQSGIRFPKSELDPANILRNEIKNKLGECADNMFKNIENNLQDLYVLPILRPMWISLDDKIRKSK